MRDELEFKGYWSPEDKELWLNTNWSERNYEELPVEGDEISEYGYFYSSKKGCILKPVTFIKYIRSNPIYPPYYGPKYTSELLEYMKEGNYCYPCYDGRQFGNYDKHDRFDDEELADMLSR